MVGIGDFNGDGTSDLLLENGSGGLIDWIMQNGTYSSYNAIGNTSGYGVIGTGDFSGNGTTDVLLQNGGGSIIDWIINNGAYSSYNSIGNANASGYGVVGTGDFNADGTSDLLLELSSICLIERIASCCCLNSDTSNRNRRSKAITRMRKPPVRRLSGSRCRHPNR